MWSWAGFSIMIWSSVIVNKSGEKDTVSGTNRV
jgi:hypothetical protein